MRKTDHDTLSRTFSTSPVANRGLRERRKEVKNRTSIPAFNPAKFDCLIADFYALAVFGKARKFKRLRKKAIKWLRKPKYKDHQPSSTLAAKLEGCEPKARCKSAACPECRSAARKLVIEVGSDFLHRKAKTETVVFVTIVPADGIAGKGELEADQHQRNVRRWKEKLGRAGVTWFFGASDWSWNEDKAGRYAHHWSHHVCGFTSTSDPEELKKRLKQQFPNSTVSPKPVRLDVWDGDDRAIKYICKSKFLRRIGIQGKRFNKGIGKHRACRATDKQPLRSAEKRELLLHLDQIGLQARLVLRQLQIVHRGSAGPAAVERGGNGRARGGAGKW